LVNVWCCLMWGGSESTLVSASAPTLRVAFTRRRVLLMGLRGDGEWSPEICVCVSLVWVPECAVRQFCGGLDTMCVVEPRVCGECGADVVHQATTFPEGDGGVPVSSHLRSALCRAIMCPRLMHFGGISCGCLSPRRRWRVVLMANLPHDHAGKGASFWTAILSTLLYAGRVGKESPPWVKDYWRALCSCASRAGYEAAAGRRGSSIVQYSSWHR